MKKVLSQIMGVLIGGLALVGLFVEGHVMGLMNVDMTLDILRIPLAIALLYVGFVANNERLAGQVLTGVGGLYVGMGLLGFVDATMFGLLPSGLTAFDLIFHLVTGVLALGVGLMSDKAAASSNA